MRGIPCNIIKELVKLRYDNIHFETALLPYGIYKCRSILLIDKKVKLCGCICLYLCAYLMPDSSSSSSESDYSVGRT